MPTETGAANIFPIVIDPAANHLRGDHFEHHSRGLLPPPYSTTIFEALWTHAIDGMRLTDENGTIVAVNHAFCALVGMKEHELIGKPFTMMYPHPTDRERLLSVYRMVFSSGLYQTIYELHPVLLSGKILEVETLAACVESDKGKKLLLTQFRDVAERNKTERILHESESKYRGLFANSIQPMFESTIDGQIVNANKSFLRLLGYEAFDDVARLNFLRDIYVHTDTYHDIMTVLETRGYIRNIELQIKRKNGNTITVVENARALYDETGKMTGMEGVFEDVTVKNNLEQKLHRSLASLQESKHKLTELNAEKSKLLSFLSHDLRSPFSSILGFCDVLMKENESLSPEERLEYIRYIFESAQDQLSTLNNLLDWTRMESGRFNFDARDLDLNRIAQKVINALSGLARSKEIRLTNTIPLNTFTHGDGQLLYQLFSNLISNSLKFTPPNGGIFIELVKHTKEHWTLAVRDTGVGIPESDIPKLFKIEEKYTRKGLSGERGTGLGLPVCQEIIQKHKGTIAVKSTYGKGTTFYLQFPKVILQPGKSILVVDDEQGIRTLHTKYLQRLLPAVNIIQASDGEEAFDIAQSYQPMLIITDHGMPHVNGKEFVRRLKENATTQSIPVLFATGYSSQELEEALSSVGVSTILNKPVSQERFEAELNKLNISVTK